MLAPSTDQRWYEQNVFEKYKPDNYSRRIDIEVSIITVLFRWMKIMSRKKVDISQKQDVILPFLK